jgi:hypothetical protein
LQPEESREPPAEENGGVDVFRLIALRDRLQDALKD